MLPKSIYRLLPYFYISVSLFCLSVVESRLIYFPSTMLMITAALVLWMRRRNVVNSVKYTRLEKTASKKKSNSWFNESINMGKHERRLGDERDFPLLDDNGSMIAFDRRRQQSC